MLFTLFKLSKNLGLCNLSTLNLELFDCSDDIDRLESIDALFLCRTAFVVPLHFMTNLSSSINSSLKGTWLM